MTRVYNFSAGPAMLPEEVLKQARDEMLDWQGSGMCVMEMSHRGKEFVSIAEQAESDPVEGVDFPVVQEIYVYEQEGRRDPFSPLLKEGEDSQEGQISVENLSLVGVIWGDTRRVAVLSDQAGNGYVFKVGDALPSGRVVSISDKSIVFELSQFGIVTKYEIVMEE